MAAPAPVLLGLRDEPLPRTPPAQQPQTLPPLSRIGGTPDCIPSVTLSNPSCGICGAGLAHIIQIYSPLEGSPFHRVINVFACARKSCWGKPESWKVLRSQYLQVEVKEKEDCRLNQKPECLFATTDWCEGANDWEEGSEMSSDDTASHNHDVCVLSDSLPKEKDCAFHFQGLSLHGVPDISDLLLSSNPISEEGATFGSVPVFQPYYISVADEKDYLGYDSDTKHAYELLKEYQQTEGLNLEQLMSGRFGTSGGDERYEKSEAEKRDQVFHKFMKRISACQEQILSSRLHYATHFLFMATTSDEAIFEFPRALAGHFQAVHAAQYESHFLTSLITYSQAGKKVAHTLTLVYSWGGQPLFVTCPSSDMKTAAPPCNNCKSKRIFEFQLMPALVSMLKTRAEDVSVEFGTVIVYTCEKSCWADHQLTPLEEFLFVQEDPDQQLFK